MNSVPIKIKPNKFMNPEELLNKLMECVEFGKVNKNAPFPPAMKGQDGADELTRLALDMGIQPTLILNEALIKGQEKSEYFFQFIEADSKIASYLCYGHIPCTVGSYGLYWIATHNNYRGKGMGKLILEKTHETIKNRNGRMVIAETSGTQKYISTRKFYENNGYKAEAIIKDFYQTGDDKIMYVFRF